MAERFNGNAPFQRKNYGSDRRGVAPVPSFRLFERQSQSKKDWDAMLARIHERRQASMGLGNKDLPAFQHKFELIENIESYKAVILGGATGSGKSTQLPQYLYEAGYDMTVVLVPRRVIADGLGDRLRDEFSEQLPEINAGELVGIVHGERVERHDENKIMVVTPNTYIRMEDEIKERFGGKKVAIIADEIHEANIFTEIATGVAAMSVKERETWRLIAASATHNAATLEAPFQEINHGYVPVIEIAGRPSELTQREEPKLNPMQAYAKHGADHERSMIFTSGKQEIDYVIEELGRELDKVESGSSEKVVFRKLHGELTERELSHINDPVPEGHRLCIVSSPAGMSGITIPGLTLVVTDGTINRSELDDDGVPGLVRRYLSRAGIIQQFGRAGRDVVGGVGILAAPVNIKVRGQRLRHTDEEGHFSFIPFGDSDRAAHEPPEIWDTNLSRVTLSVAAVKRRFHDINNYIPHPVDKGQIINAEEALARIGMLDDDASITDVGLRADSFPVAPELGRGLIEALGISRTIEQMGRAAFIAAAIDAGGVHERPGPNSNAAELQKYLRDSSNDDFIAQLDFMSSIHSRSGERELFEYELREMGFSPKRVQRARKVARQILKESGIQLRNIVSSPPLPDEEDALRSDFTSGFIDYTFQNIGRDPRSKKLIYRNIHGNKESTKRYVDSHSFSTIGEGQFIAGIPRYRIDRKTGVKHDLIGFVMPVDPKVVGQWALHNGIVHNKLIDSGIEDGRAVDYSQKMFGTISVGGRVRSEATGIVSEKAQQKLYEYVQENPGRELLAYRSIVKSLDRLRELMPADELEMYRRDDAPEDVTLADIDVLVAEAVKTTVYAHEVNEFIRDEMYSRGLSLGRYYGSDALKEIAERSPSVFTVAGVPMTIYYDKGQPYVTNLTRAQKRAINESVYLNDGREIFFQRPISHGGKERISMAKLKMD